MKISNSSPKSIYSSFDVFPTRKGAAIHIDKFARALFEQFDGGLLYVLGNEQLPDYQIEDKVEIIRFNVPEQNYLRRALMFSENLSKLLDECEEGLQICHFRDIWSGLAILGRERTYKTLFEVNGLPSIELLFLYSNIATETLEKIKAQEKLCLEQSDFIITPSHSIKQKALSYGIAENKVQVIPNGAFIKPKAEKPIDAPEKYLLYFGALQSWQGVDVLLRAFARLRDLEDLYLVICASNYSRRAKILTKLAEKLEVNDRIIWNFGLREEDLAPWRDNALLSVAPLTECSRNIEQGCAPLKILESMASGVPVIASDLPSVREIMTDREHGRLIQPDRFGELARVIRVLLQYPDKLAEMGANARQKIEKDFLWEHSIAKLKEIYVNILQN
ncbi:MAG TPA: glycosyltransferase family 4 protein [Pyrinomonadaceae bacterium]|nr:glycosyltransferase family 4 protein [Pyrinomonadaceae bacterium]